MTLTQQQIARIKTLENATGHVTAPQVVADAKDKRSPLHSLFDWNIKAAAHKHWLWQAREIIGSVTIVIANETTTIKAPIYVHLKETGYQNVAHLRRDPAQARESLVYTLEMASGHLRRAFDLASPLGLQSEIDVLLAQIAGVQRVIRQAA